MNTGGWLQEHWFDILQSAGIIGGILFTAASLRIDAKVRRVSNLFRVTANHREIWSQLIQNPELSRVLHSALDLEAEPITSAEQVFVISVILHLRAVLEASNVHILVPPEQIEKDVQWFFSLPIPERVWRQFGPIQDLEFRRFVETLLEK